MSTRTINLSEEVKKIWGKAWNEPDIEYEFSSKTFKRRTEEAEIYSATPGNAVAAFAGTPLTGSGPLSVTFTDASTGSVTTWKWQKNAGDGLGWIDFSTAQNPTEIFAVGTWSVRLKVENYFSFDWEEKADYVVSS
jgi:PKD repeat protein